MSGRPLDVLEAAVGDEVEVRLKSGETYRGTLAGYDQHMNLVLDDAAAAPGGGSAGASGNEGADASGNEAADASGDDAAGTPGDQGAATSGDGAAGTSEEADGLEEAADSAAETPADNRDTTIIRGDNVVSITP